MIRTVKQALLLCSLSLLCSTAIYGQARTRIQTSQRTNTTEKKATSQAQKFQYVTLAYGNRTTSFRPSNYRNGGTRIYESISGPEKVLLGRIVTQNLYKVDLNYVGQNQSKYYKLYDLDGKYKGWVSALDFNFADPPTAPQFEMVHVEGGTFNMGNNSDPEASPVHKVTLSDFDICKFEVSHQQWRQIMGAKASLVICWNDVQNYIKILNKISGKHYRLPTEAEWEYAAIGGKLSKGFKYSGGNDIGMVAVYKGNSYSEENQGYFRARPGCLLPNELGLYDMSGNLWEFCADTYEYYHEEDQTNPLVIDNNKVYKVLRGGGYLDPEDCCEARRRDKVTAEKDNLSYGFRLVLDNK